MRRARQGGFTMIEVMVSMGLLVIGLMGILALHAVTVRGNRASRELERARVLAVQLMEDLRGRKITELGEVGDHPYDTVSPVEGVTYTRGYSLAAVTGSTSLLMLTTTVTFPDDDDSGIIHSASMQMMRTEQESL